MPAFKAQNWIIVWGQPVQPHYANAPWEAQVALGINDFRGLIREAIEQAGPGTGGPFIRHQGDFIEVCFVHNTKAAAAETVDRLVARIKAAVAAAVEV